jgi:hypothetical protein
MSQVESTNKTLGKILANLVNANRTDWDVMLVTTLWAYHTTYCESFLHTFNMKNMHSQNRLELELLCNYSLISKVIQCNAMKFTKNLMHCVHLENTKTLWENRNSP